MPRQLGVANLIINNWDSDSKEIGPQLNDSSDSDNDIEFQLRANLIKSFFIKMIYF